MTEPKRHHYLPRFYLRNFCRDDFLWVFDREEKEYRRQHPVDTGVITKYYTAEGPDGTENVEIEKFFSYIEGETKPVIEKVDAAQNLTLEEKGKLAVFVAFLHTRVPAFEKTMNEFTVKSFKKITQMLCSTEENTEKIIKDIEEKEGQEFGMSAKEFMAAINSDDYELKQGNRGYTLHMMIHSAERAAALFQDMDWLFLRCNEETAFITTDNPFLITPPKNHSKLYGVGMITPGAKKLIPLTSKTSLIMGDLIQQGAKQKILYAPIPRAEVRKINSLLAAGCDRFILGRDKALLQRLVKITKINEWKPKSRVEVT